MPADTPLPSFFDETSDRTIAGDVRALPKGYRIDEFEILEVIGSGGFGIVYKAFDHSLNQARAIKEYLPRGLAGRFSTRAVTVLSKEDETSYREGLARFVAEARLLAGINHPAIVRVYRCIEANETAYMVMDLCQGETLEKRLARSVAFDEAAMRRFLADLLGGVEAIHAHHILHRDIKPANIYLGEDGRPVLIDFGSAREVAGSNQAMTAIVTYNYSAPEQWDSTGQFSQGPYSDVYSLGATAYQMVTGRKPNASNTRLLRDSVVPAVDAAKGRYSEHLLATIDKALRVPVKERYQTAREWLDDLAGGEARAEKRGRPMRYVVIAVLLVIGVAGGLFYAKRHRTAAAAEAVAAAAVTPAGPAAGTLLRDCPGCPEMVVVPKGEFAQGGAGNNAEKDELPRHKVAIDYDFAVGRLEVTIAQFREFVNASGYSVPSDAACGRRQGNRAERSWKDPGFTQRDDEPVVCVSWFDAAAYAAWLSKVTGHHYRLLTESEWEYAARAGSELNAPWGDDPSKACDYANVGDASYVARMASKMAAAKCDDQSAFTAAGSPELRKNAFGLHDMLGNAAEWIADCQSADYTNAPADGHAVDSPTCQARGYRGGAFNYPVAEVRYSRRETLPPGERKPFIGLRVARDLDAGHAAPPASPAAQEGATAKKDAAAGKAASAKAKPSSAEPAKAPHAK